MEEIKVGKQTKNRAGHLGARMFVRIKNGGHFARYEFDTHGLKSAEAAAKVEEIRAHHAAWAQRLTGFRLVVGVEIVDDTRLFRIVDCTIPSRGGSQDVTLIVGVREIVDEKLLPVEGFPVSTVYPSIADVPANGVIIEGVRLRLEEWRSRRDAHNAYTNKVAAMVAAARVNGRV